MCGAWHQQNLFTARCGSIEPFTHRGRNHVVSQSVNQQHRHVNGRNLFQRIHVLVQDEPNGEQSEGWTLFCHVLDRSESTFRNQCSRIRVSCCHLNGYCPAERMSVDQNLMCARL